MPARKILISVLECECSECSHNWVTEKNEMPESCPSCQSSDWNQADQSSIEDMNEVGEASTNDQL